MECNNHLVIRANTQLEWDLLNLNCLYRFYGENIVLPKHYCSNVKIFAFRCRIDNKLTMVDTVGVLQMTRQESFILKQFLTELALHGLVPVRRLVSFPPLIVQESLVTEVAGVAVLRLLVVHGGQRATRACLGLLLRRWVAELGLDVLYEMHPGVFPESLLVREDLAAHRAVEHQARAGLDRPDLSGGREGWLRLWSHGQNHRADGRAAAGG